MLGKRKGKQRREYVPDYVLYDLETTGISSLYDEVIEISAVKVRNGKIVDEFSELVNPGRPIPYAASSVNNISDKMVENARSFEKVLPEFLAFAGDDVLAGHNIAGFDMKFLYIFWADTDKRLYRYTCDRKTVFSRMETQTTL